MTKPQARGLAKQLRMDYRGDLKRILLELIEHGYYCGLHDKLLAAGATCPRCVNDR